MNNKKLKHNNSFEPIKLSYPVELPRFYCTLHASTKQCKWFMNDKNACKECAYKTKI